MNPLHLPTFAQYHQDTSLHIRQVHQQQVHLKHNLIRVQFLISFLLPNINAEHIACTGISVNAVSVWIVFCKYCSHRILSPYRQSIISYKNQKHFNQFTMSLLFCVILFYIIFLVSAAASVGTEQMSTGHLVVFALLRSVQSGHPPDVLHSLYLSLSEFVNTDGRYNSY